MAMIKKISKRIDVRPAAPTPGDDLIWDNRNRIFDIVQRAVWLDDKRKRKLRLLEKGMCSGDRV